MPGASPPSAARRRRRNDGGIAFAGHEETDCGLLALRKDLPRVIGESLREGGQRDPGGPLRCQCVSELTPGQLAALVALALCALLIALGAQGPTGIFFGEA